MQHLSSMNLPTTIWCHYVPNDYTCRSNGNTFLHVTYYVNKSFDYKS